jgi:hypothetical protein
MLNGHAVNMDVVPEKTYNFAINSFLFEII